MNCPCQSGQPFLACCQPFIDGARLPATPEQLMRSRYSAYALKNLKYIQATMYGPASKGFDLDHALNVAEDTHWLGLEVAPTSPPLQTAEKGWVTFIAYYQYQNKDFRIFEKSEFRKKEGKWLYFCGKKLNPELIPKFFRENHDI